MKIKYKAIKNNGLRITEKQIKQAEKLQKQGWKILLFESYSILLEK